ncbi:MAG: hypothetical protein ACYDD0_10130 [Candidatus Dormibacteria bacterium]
MEALGAALAERVMAVLRTQERLLALESTPSGQAPEPDERQLGEVLLRRALQCLSGSSEYRLADQMLRAGGPAAGAESAQASSLQSLSQAGLASWDPSTDELRPTALLAALMGIFEPAIQGLSAPPRR